MHLQRQRPVPSERTCRQACHSPTTESSSTHQCARSAIARGGICAVAEHFLHSDLAFMYWPWHFVQAVQRYPPSMMRLLSVWGFEGVAAWPVIVTLSRDKSSWEWIPPWRCPNLIGLMCCSSLKSSPPHLSQASRDVLPPHNQAEELVNQAFAAAVQPKTLA